MKIVKCSRCKYQFKMPDNFLGSILCETCDPHMETYEPIAPEYNKNGVRKSVKKSRTKSLKQ